MTRLLVCVPDDLGRDVLHSALDPPDAAVAAWHRVRARLDLTSGSPRREVHRLLPLVYRNLPAGAVDEHDRAALAARWNATQRDAEGRVALAAHSIALLRSGGVEGSVLKGVPLALRDYGDLGSRPMQDVDLLVPREQIDLALDLLERAGWRDAAGTARPVQRRIHHGTGLVRSGTGIGLDVHWQLAGFLGEDFAARLEPIEVAGDSATTLDRTDTLVHVCLHGGWTGSAATTRWVADAVTVLRSATRDGASIDAGRVLAVAEQFGLGAILADALHYLATEFDAPVPRGLTEQLRTQRVGWRIRHRQHVVTTPVDARERVRGVHHLRAYWAYTRWDWTDRRALRTLPTFLTLLWGLDTPRQLPAAVVRRGPALLRGHRPTSAGRPGGLDPPAEART